MYTNQTLTDRTALIGALMHRVAHSAEELAGMSIEQLQSLHTDLEHARLRTCVFCLSKFLEYELKCPNCQSLYAY